MYEENYDQSLKDTKNLILDLFSIILDRLHESENKIFKLKLEKERSKMGADIKQMNADMEYISPNV